MKRRLALALLALLWSAMARAGEASKPLPPLPEGDSGIAAKYPGDIGIEKDPAVLLHDNFESGNLKKWDSHNHDEFTRFTEDPADVHGGKKTLEFTVPKTQVEVGNSMTKRFKPGHDVLFIRYYSKFDKGFDQVGSSHNGCYISASYNRDGRATPGERADGKNKFLVGLENSRFDEKLRSPGELNFYVYHPEQRSGYGDHFNPSGKVMPYDPKLGNHNTFGPSFVKRPEFIPQLDHWYCFEFMVKTNTPGERNGRIACWIDGKLAADIPNFRLRDVETLKIDECSLSLHVNCKTQRDNKKWYDDVVIASSYIGPISKAKKTPAGGANRR